MEEEKILKFYDSLVALLQKNKTDYNSFDEFVTAFLCGHELGDTGVCTTEFYESLLITSIAFFNQLHGDGNNKFNMHPFDIIDEAYYDNLRKEYVTENVLGYRRLLFTSQFARELNSKSNSYAYLMVQNARPEYLGIYKEFGKLKEIIRQGWVKRKVNPDFNESDATHSLQMLALASVCFRLYPLEHLDKQKVYEMIIIHEIAETIVGDIVENSDEHLTKSEKERIAVHKIFANLQYKDYFINLWEEFESRKSEEAKFVYELDKLDPVLKARYLDKELGRDDLFDDFYDYEDKRGTFIDTPLQKLFYSNMY